MHSLKVHMVTMETTFHKINCWQYIHAIIMAEVALLNVYFVYNCNFLEYKYIEIIYLDINISVCIGTYSLLTDLMLKPRHYTHPSAELTERWGAKNLQHFVQS